MAKVLLRKIVLENVGQHRGPLELGPFAEGINLITGPNESGKTTLVKALRAVMFERHNAKHAQIKELQPYHEPKAAPRVLVELSFGGEPVTIKKRFLEKPAAELRVGGGAPLIGAEADARLRELLGASEPGKQGAKAEDLGMWGLLWLDQDETARSEPGESLTADTRGRLTEIIQRQVGQVTGGRSAERLHAKLSELLGLYWTPEQQQPTGDHGRALARVEELSAQIGGLERQAAALQTQGEALDRARSARDAAERELVQREAELTQARAAADEAAQLAARRDEAWRLHQAAQERLAHAREVWAARAALAEALDQKTAALEVEAQHLGELEALVRAAETEVKERRAELEVCTEAHARARAQRERAMQLITETTDREAWGRRIQRHAEAAQLRAELSQLDARAAEAISEAHYRALQAGAHEVLALERACASAAAHLALRVSSEPEASHVITAETTLSTPRGPLRVRPGRAGLAKAAAALRTSAARLEEALRGAGVGDVHEARRLRARRAAAESRAVELQLALDQAAPDGLDTLAAELEAARGDEAGRVQGLEAAEAAADRAAALREALEPQRVREADARELRSLSEGLKLAESRLSALGTRVVVRAAQALALELPDGETLALDPGAEHALTVTRSSGLGVRGVVELSIEPLGGDLAQAEREVASRRTRLEEALSRLGVASVTSAEEAAARRAGLEASLAEAERELSEHAPEGLAALRAQRTQSTARREGLERSLQSARTAQVGLEPVSAELHGNAVTEAVLANLEQLQAAEAAGREAAEGLAATLWLPGEAEPRAVLEPELGATDGLEWALSPGEMSPDLISRWEAAREALSSALAARGVTSLDEAEARWRLGLQLEPQRARLTAELERAPPTVVDPAFAARLAGIDPEKLGDPGAVEGEVEAASAAHARAQEEEAKARAALDCAARAEEQAHARCAPLEREAAARRGALEALRREVDELRSKLEAQRGARTDTALSEAEASAARAAEETAAAVVAAEAALAGVELAFAARGVQAAQHALEQCRARERGAGEAAVRAEALLEVARAAGGHEALLDLRAELAEAEAQRARLVREAEAVRLLARLAEEERAKAEARLLQPLLDVVGPYVRTLRPGTELRLSDELRVDSAVRAGVKEALAQLSGGTREQLAVIVRLGLAQVLAKGGHVFPLILDDTMGWTDDQRFGEMVKILDAAAEEMQIVVLSCHPTRFERLRAGWRLELGGGQA